MNLIEVKNLKKFYQVYKKEPGFANSIKSLFSRKYEEVKAVNNVSFNIKEGELIGFIGPNGAGKTTTLKCLSGLLYPNAGEISVLGYKPWERKPQFQKQISLVMGQKNQLWWDLPPTETFVLNKEIYGISEDKYKQTLNELVELLDIKDILNVQVRKLSLGQRMKCELISALLHNPKILFLDEPTIGLDVVMQKKLREFIKAYNEKYHATIILTSHYMQDVEALCKRVIIINHGELLFDGELSNLIKRYSPYKIINLILQEKVDKSKIESLGKIKTFNFPQLELLVPMNKSSQAASKIIRDLPIEDLNIKDPDIEDIIREIFVTPQNGKILISH